MYKIFLGVLIIFLSLFPTILKASHYDSIDVVHYEITLEITDFNNQMIYGYTELKILPKFLPLDKINLDLQELVVDSIMVNNQKVNNFIYDDRTLQIFLPSVINTYDTISVVVYYFGHPAEDPSPNKWGGFKWTSNSAFNLGVGFAAIPHCFGRAWFPCNDDFEDRATFNFNIITNAVLNHTAVCNGKMTYSSDNCSGKRMCRWEMQNPIPTYLASVAVGNYICLRDTFNGIANNVPIEIWVNPEDSIKAKNSFINLKNILQLFESKFGPYRWNKVGYVSVEFNSGAMEHATNIAYPKLAINGNTTYEKLYSHELFHHWFGNLITCKKAEEMWINEGWATFSEFLYDETFSGYQTYLINKRTTLHDVLRYAHIEDSGYFALNNVPQYNTYGKTSYDKGALIVLNLRQFLGDSVFYSVMKQYLNDRAFQPVSSEDMSNYLSTHANPDVKHFFETYVFTPGFPHFSIDSFLVEQNNNGWKVIVYSKEKLRHRNTYSVYAKSKINFIDSLWNIYSYDIHLRNGYGVDTFFLNFKPVEIFIDLFEEINDATTDQYKIIKNTGNITFDKTYFNGQVIQLTDSAFLQVIHNWVAPDYFLNPIPGLIISKSRYWEIRGIIKNGTIIKGKFQYNRSSTSNSAGLDNDLITGNIDSLVLLYRPNRATNWQIIPFSKIGTPYNGYLVVDTIKTGEYALGYWNWQQWIYYKSQNLSNNKLEIFPNPALDSFTIKYDFLPGNIIEIFSLTGKKVYNQTITENKESIKINTSNLKKGTYLVSVKNNNEIKVAKLVIE